jgi:hypothetical protein
MATPIKLDTSRARQASGTQSNLRVLIVSMLCALTTAAFVYFYVLPRQQAAVSTPANPVETTQKPG